MLIYLSMFFLLFMNFYKYFFFLGGEVIFYFLVYNSYYAFPLLCIQPLILNSKKMNNKLGQKQSSYYMTPNASSFQNYKSRREKNKIQIGFSKRKSSTITRSFLHVAAEWCLNIFRDLIKIQVVAFQPHTSTLIDGVDVNC